MPAGTQHEPRHRLPTRQPDRGRDGAAPPDNRTRATTGPERGVESSIPPGPWNREALDEPVESEASAAGGRSSHRA